VGFDARVRLDGLSPKVLAVLGQDLRTRLLAVLGRWRASIAFQVPSPVLFLHRKYQRAPETGLPSPVPDLLKVVDDACALLEKLSIAPAEIPGRLAHNARHDRSPWVRCRNLHALIVHYRENPAVSAVVAEALRDSSRAVQAIAGTFAGDEAAIKRLPHIVTVEKVSEELCVTALEYLARHFPAAKIRAVILEALHASHDRVRLVALRAAAESGDAEMVNAACDRVKRAKRTEIELVMQALARTHPPCAEAAVLTLVACRDLDSTLCALDVLEQIGTERSVGPLLELVSDRILGASARAALARIQARTRGLDGGRLSLASPDPGAGAVSLAGSSGELELAPPPDKRQS
jgi:hypothetical protein